MFRKANKYIILMAIFFMFSATGVFAEEVDPGDDLFSCSDGGVTISIVPGEDNNFPVPMPDGCGQDNDDCWVYEYSSSVGWSEAGQTVPGEDSFMVWLENSNSSVHWDPAPRPGVKKLEFGSLLWERGVVSYTADPKSGGNKFQYMANYNDIGLTTVYFKNGNNLYSCPIYGPVYVPPPPEPEPPYIQRTELYKKFDHPDDDKPPILVKFSVDYNSCVYDAWPVISMGIPATPENPEGVEEELGAPFIPFLESEINITVPDLDLPPSIYEATSSDLVEGDDVSGDVYESNSGIKCNEYTIAFGTGTCSIYNLGGYVIRIPKNCDPNR